MGSWLGEGLTRAAMAGDERRRQVGPQLGELDGAKRVWTTERSSAKPSTMTSSRESHDGMIGSAVMAVAGLPPSSSRRSSTSVVVPDRVRRARSYAGPAGITGR